MGSKYWQKRRDRIIWGVMACALIAYLLFFRLGALPGGVSNAEQHTAMAVYGWHGLYAHSFYLPINILRSIFFKAFGHASIWLVRLPSVIFGALTIMAFAVIIWLWHGIRTAILTTLLFACSAWMLHISRLATNDILYAWAIVTLLLINVLLKKYPDRGVVYWGSMLLWGSMLYIPGMVWLVILGVIWQISAIKEGWSYFNLWWQRLLYVISGVIWLPLLGHQLLHFSGLRTWLGVPQHFVSPLLLLRQFGAVLVHLFARGPLQTDLWLGRAPLLDIFTLTISVLGIYFYVTHWRAERSRLLLSFFIISWLLVGTQGPVSLSLLVPLLYISAAAGLAYLLREWLKVFPHNPLARSLGIGLLLLAISLSCLYNTRAYFVAWAYNPVTRHSFHRLV